MNVWSDTGRESDGKTKNKLIKGYFDGVEKVFGNHVDKVQERMHGYMDDKTTTGSWDEMIYLMSASARGGGSTITMTLRDHTSSSVLERFWGPGSSESGTLGTIPSPSGEYTLTASFTGQTELSIMIAGGIGYSWSL